MTREQIEKAARIEREYANYEEAFEAGLQEAIKLIKK